MGFVWYLPFSGCNVNLYIENWQLLFLRNLQSPSIPLKMQCIDMVFKKVNFILILSNLITYLVELNFVLNWTITSEEIEWVLLPMLTNTTIKANKLDLLM